MVPTLMMFLSSLVTWSEFFSQWRAVFIDLFCRMHLDGFDFGESAVMFNQRCFNVEVHAGCGSTLTVICGLRLLSIGVILEAVVFEFCMLGLRDLGLL